MLLGRSGPDDAAVNAAIGVHAEAPNAGEIRTNLPPPSLSHVSGAALFLRDFLGLARWGTVFQLKIVDLAGVHDEPLSVSCCDGGIIDQPAIKTTGANPRFLQKVFGSFPNRTGS